MRIPVTFALIGLLTGGLTLAVIAVANDMILSPGLLFAGGLGLGTWLAQRGLGFDDKFKPQGLLGAFLLVALSFPGLVQLLLAVAVITSHLSKVLLDIQGDPLMGLIPYWVGLFVVGGTGALILWTSLWLLRKKVEVSLLWRMVGASLLVCGTTIAGDIVMVKYYGFASYSYERRWTGWIILFLMGNTLMSFLYGVGTRPTGNTLPGQGVRDDS